MWMSIVGPTAVGKTSFALEVAHVLLAEQIFEHIRLVSADSRQVYRGLEITSGADVPETFFQVSDEIEGTHFENKQGTLSLWGISMIEPSADWSVAHFQRFVSRLMAADSPKVATIIVGGTGLYHSQLIQTDPVLHIPPNDQVREQAEQSTLSELQEWLARINQDKWLELNNSDRHNPRRLVRAIEIALAQTADSHQTEPVHALPSPLVTIGLDDAFTHIEARIKQRVVERFAAGAAAEVEKLQDQALPSTAPIFSATGVKVLLGFNRGEVDMNTVIDTWARQERQYAKRQLTWYQKQATITWFSLEQPDWKTAAISMIKTLVTA